MPQVVGGTGSDFGSMMIVDDGLRVSFYLLYGEYPPPEELVYVPQVPWQYVLDGVESGWQSYEFYSGEWAGTGWKMVGQWWIDHSQTVIFRLGDTGSEELGGPAELSMYINRGAPLGVVHIRVGTEIKQAIPYVNDEGVWKVAEPWAKYIGLWKQSV